MMRGLILALALVACSQPAEAPSAASEAAPAADLVSFEGYGPIRIGMTLEEAAAAQGAPLVLDPPLDDPHACQTFRLSESDREGQPVFMAQQDRVSRVSFYQGATARTPEGVGVGSTSAEVRAAYPNAIEQAPPYDEAPAHVLLVWTTPETAGYRFEVGQDGIVSTMHAGGPSIQLIEGCA